MKRYNEPIELIIEYRQDPLMKTVPDIAADLEAAGIPVEKTAPLFKQVVESKDLPADSVLATKVTVRTAVNDVEVHPWDLAHAALNSGANYRFIEPDLWQEYTVEDKMPDHFDTTSAKSFGTEAKGDDVDPDWPPSQNLVWHLDDDHSQLGSARKEVAELDDYIVRIGHLDTGYTDHFAIPQEIRDNPYQQNFIEDEQADKALDIGSKGMLRQPYHGTGTGGILAGDKIQLTTTTGEFNDYLGAAYFAEVISCRISKSVILFKTSAFAQALNYLTDLVHNGIQVHVVSMSMGGAPSRAWADAVNAAYEAGITIVTAAGNNFAGLPTRHVVYPARFQRVIAACGVTYNNAPYYTSLINEMQGNYGPSKDMQKALAAFTPNILWANYVTGTVQFNGAGTSSATPQIAAAAAIYYKKNHQELDAAEPWQRVEAIRNALFSTAKKTVKPGFGDYSQYFGNGIVQASDALKVPVKTDIAQTPEDSSPWFPILNTLFKEVPDEKQQSRLDMFNTELWQLLYSYPELARQIGDDEVDFNEISALHWDSFANAVMEHPAASKTLKAFLKSKFN